MTAPRALVLQRLDLDRLPGIADGFAVTAAPGVNLVCGPNESGKSSLARAVTHLLWPDEPVAPPLDVKAVFGTPDGPLHAARLDDGPVAWTRDGAPAPAPRVPGGHLAQCYRLGLLDLHRRPDAADVEHDLAREVRRQMAGGFDLAAVRADFPDEPRKATLRRRAWEDAVRAAETLRNEQGRLAAEVSRLAELEDELAAARGARRRLGRLQTALELRRIDAREAELTAALAALPAGTDRVQDGDDETLEGLDRRLQRLAAGIGRLAAELVEQDARLAALDPGEGLPRAARLVEAAVATGNELDKARARLADTTGAADAARGNLPPELLADDAPPDAAEAYADLRTIHLDALRLTAAREHFTRLRDDDTPAAPADTPAAAADLAPLSALLAAGLAAGGAGSPLPGGLALVAGAAALVLGLVTGPDPLLVGTGAVVALGGLAALIAQRQAQRAEARARAALEAAFADAGRPLPAGWSGPHAIDHFAALRAERVRAEAEADADARWHTDAKRRLAEAARAEEDLAARRRALRDAWGGRLDTERPDLLLDLERLARWRDADAARAGAERAHAEAEGRHRDALDAAGAALRAAGQEVGQEAGQEAAATVDAVRTALEALQRAADERRTLAGQREKTVERLADATAERDEATADRDRLLARIALPEDAARAEASGAEAGPTLNEDVARRVAALPEWRRLEADLRHERQRRAAMQAELEAEPPADPADAPAALLALDAQTLADRIAEATGRADSVEELSNRITAIGSRAQAARAGDAWEQARARADRAEAEWRDTADAQRANLFARLLLDEVAAEHQALSHPPLLQAADRYLDGFTAGRYRLRVAGAEHDDGFVALDAAERPVALGDLSDGTRAQVLLAVRLAFLDQAESGPSAPLFLDEALTASDPDRFAAIAGAVGVLARDTGRQVFYLTSDPQDVAGWRRALDAKGLDAPQVIDLAVARRLGAAASPDDLALPARPAVPAPDGDDAVAYALRLGVTPVRPWRPAAELDLFHLLRDDLPLVHALARSRIRTVGPWRRQKDALVRAGVVSPEQRARLDARLGVWQVFREAWRIGRGRPLTRDDLTAADIFTATMAGPACDLLDEVGGDGRAFLARVRDGDVKRLRQDTKNALQEFLEREGHVDERPVKSVGDLVAMALAAAAPALETGTLDRDEVAALVQDLLAAAG